MSEMGSNVGWVGRELAKAEDEPEEGGWRLERLLGIEPRASSMLGCWSSL